MYEWDYRMSDEEKEVDMTELEKKWGSVVIPSNQYQYKTVHDAFALYGTLPNLMRGSTEIWYQKPSVFGRVNEKNTDPENLNKTHVLLGRVLGRDLEDLFHDFQGDFWSPQGEARHLISSKGLGHTSMSTGDVIVVGGKAYIVAIVGFKRLGESDGT